jgi:hypothetical protein
MQSIVAECGSLHASTCARIPGFRRWWGYAWESSGRVSINYNCLAFSNYLITRISLLSRVIASKHADYPKGTAVLGYFGWRELSVIQPDLMKRRMYFYKLPDMKGLPPSYALGAVGMPG